MSVAVEATPGPEPFDGTDHRREGRLAFESGNLARAVEHLLATCETSSGRLPPASRSYRQRFGGLEEASLRRAG